MQAPTRAQLCSKTTEVTSSLYCNYAEPTLVTISEREHTGTTNIWTRPVCWKIHHDLWLGARITIGQLPKSFLYPISFTKLVQLMVWLFDTSQRCCMLGKSYQADIIKSPWQINHDQIQIQVFCWNINLLTTQPHIHICIHTHKQSVCSSYLKTHL